MFKKLFQFPSTGQDPAQNGAVRNSICTDRVPVGSEAADSERPSLAPKPAAAQAAGLALATPISFEQVYQHAAVKPPRIVYGILKVADMVNSPHLATMSTEAKRSALLMALEAAGAEIEDLLQDAVIRQRALTDYEDMLQEKLRQFEAAKAQENSQVQADLDRLTAQYMARIQANVDEVAREQDSFRAWQKRKHQEAQRITEAARFCVAQDGSLNGDSLTAVLERASALHR